VPQGRKKTGHEGRLLHMLWGQESTQTGDVIGHRFDFAVIEFGRHLGHGQVVLAHAIAKPAEL
jgi:hypothetical protein